MTMRLRVPMARAMPRAFRRISRRLPAATCCDAGISSRSIGKFSDGQAILPHRAGAGAGASAGASAGADAWFAAGLVVFAAAKALKYWAIASLGPRWTFRVLVPPGSARTVSGPYRWLAHPNYVAVTGELAGVAVAMHALVSGPLAVAGFGWLMLRRISIEEKALARG